MVLKKYLRKKLGRKRFSRRSTVRSLSKRVKVLESEDECKIRYDLSYITATFITQNGSIIPLNILSPGSNNSNRVGNKISMVGYRIIGSFIGGDATNYFKLAVVYDTQTQGALPAIGSIFETSTFTTVSIPMAPKNWDNRKRFRLLTHKMYVTTGPVSAPGGPGNVKCLINRKFKKPLQTIYTGAGGTIANIASGGLYFMVVSDDAPGSLTHPTFQGSITLYYKDA